MIPIQKKYSRKEQPVVEVGVVKEEDTTRQPTVTDGARATNPFYCYCYAVFQARDRYPAIGRTRDKLHHQGQEG